jgi:hypothetical protein
LRNDRPRELQVRQRRRIDPRPRRRVHMIDKHSQLRGSGIPIGLGRKRVAHHPG